MTASLTDAQLLKFALLADGLTISPEALEFVSRFNEDRPLTPADYASTTGVILELKDDVWVNAPIHRYNPNFVEDSPFVLDIDCGELSVHGNGLESPASFWLPPSYHGETGSHGRPLNYYSITHADRVRLSPIMGCSMTCKFCNIPYEDRYGTKPVEWLIEAANVAFSDPTQPAQHMLISGGTPHERDIGYLQDTYRAILSAFPDIEIDIMMVPIDGLLDLPLLNSLGVHEFSINIEIFNTDIASKLMRQKYGRGIGWYLDFLEEATSILGLHRVRSMLLVGLEPQEDTLAGVSAVLERGSVPVLSPFRPAPSTPLSDISPPSADELQETYLRASDLAAAAGTSLGPSCPPCSHNTLTLVNNPSDDLYRHRRPTMV